MIITALAIAFWTNYGISLWPESERSKNKAWQVALGTQLIPGGFLFILIWCMFRMVSMIPGS